MTTDSSSLNDLAESLINQLDRGKIFPPSYNNPEELINHTSNRSKGPPRPPNGFLLCRKNVHKEARSKGICNMRVISKVTGILWRGASSEEKEKYEKLSAQVNDLHSKRYPGYKYRPTTRQKPQPYFIPTSNIEILPTLQTLPQPPIVYTPTDPIHEMNPIISQFSQEDLILLYNQYLSNL